MLCELNSTHPLLIVYFELLTSNSNSKRVKFFPTVINCQHQSQSQQGLNSFQPLLILYVKVNAMWIEFSPTWWLGSYESPNPALSFPSGSLFRETSQNNLQYLKTGYDSLQFRIQNV